MNHDHALSAPTAPTAPKPPHARSAGATATACAPATRDGSTRCAVRRGGPAGPVRMAAASIALGAALLDLALVDLTVGITFALV